MDLCIGGNLNDCQKLAQTIHDLYEHVRRVVPKEQLFEFNPKGGYEPLCKFLDKPAPKGETYPHIIENRGPCNIMAVHPCNSREEDWCEPGSGGNPGWSHVVLLL